MNGPTIHKSSSTSRRLISEKSMGIFKAILTSLLLGQTFNYILKVYHILRHKGDEKARRLDENSDDRSFLPHLHITRADYRIDINGTKLLDSKFHGNIYLNTDNV